LTVRHTPVRSHIDFTIVSCKHNFQTYCLYHFGNKGDVVGVIEALVGFEEDLDCLYGKYPYRCPTRPGDELNMALFQVHITRITSLLEDLKTTVEMFQFVVSWKNPLLTSVSLYFFLHLVAVFDPIYIGSFPVFLGILWMIYLAVRRSYGKLNQKFIQKEIESSRKVRTQMLLL
jgi:hypothetical protein